MSDIPNKLRLCCLPVLPTIFSDELSYKEELCKMRLYINQMIDALKQQDEDIANIQKQVDKVDPSNYIQTSGGTLTGPLFFIDNAHVLKNEDGTITLSGTGLMNIHGGGIVTIDTPKSIAIRADNHVDITGSGGVEILASENGAVNIEGGAIAMTGDININGPTTFDKVDVDMLNARTKVAEPVEDANPATKKYVDAHGSSGGVTCGYITVAVDDTKNTVDVHSENLIPKGELGGYYVDNAGNLWHATQVVASGFTLENQNINVLANAEFVKITGNTSVKNINVNDTGSSTYQATTNVLVHGGTDVDITAGKGTVDVEAPIVDIHAAQHVNIDTGDGGSVVIGGAKSAVDMGNAVSVIVPTPLKEIEAANKAYVDNLIGPRMKMLKRITAQAPYLGIPGDDFANYTDVNIFIQATPDSTANEVWIGTILLLGGSVTDCHVVSIDATTGAQQFVQPNKFLVTSNGIIINGLSPAVARGCYFVIPS
jgi:hypothetical protein